MVQSPKGLLRLTFDAEQYTQVLMYDFTTADGSPARIQAGPYSGCIGYEEGDVIAIDVIMTDVINAATEWQVTGFEIISLDIVSQPNANIQSGGGSFTETDNLSPFVPDKATSQYELYWSKSKPVGDLPPGRSEFISTWEADGPLEITAPQGFWEVSGYLSVLVQGYQVIEGQKITLNKRRVFSFDPEVVSGSRDPQ